MTTLYDIPAELLIPKVAEELKKRKEIQPPAWAAFAKAGVHQQMPPEDPDWWFIRSASVLRRLYVDGPVGVQRMRTAYGGKRDRGSSPFQFRKGGGSSLRKILQQLEARKPVKVRFLRGAEMDPADLAARAGGKVLGVRGRTVVLGKGR